MDDARLDEILERLEAIERVLHDHLRDHGGERREHRHGGHGARHRDGDCCGGCCDCGCHRRGRGGHGAHRCGCSYHGHRRFDLDSHGGCGCGRGGQPFEEKRVVDLIVGLVTERMSVLLERHCASKPCTPPAGPGSAETEDGTPAG